MLFGLSSTIVVVIRKYLFNSKVIKTIFTKKRDTCSKSVDRVNRLWTCVCLLWRFYFYDFVLVVLLPTLNRFHTLIYFSCYQFWTWLLGCRGVFRTQSNICDEAFYEMVKGFQLWTILAKSSILDVPLGSRYASVVITSKTTTGFHGSNIALAIRYLKQMGLFLCFLSIDVFIRVLLFDDKLLYWWIYDISTW